ncbi:hypothetical protein C3489_36520 [Streptomyces sp. Ru71]|nr:hypothetical protein C3489_36520 [Streptomyces sp. Ru71]
MPVNAAAELDGYVDGAQVCHAVIEVEVKRLFDHACREDQKAAGPVGVASAFWAGPKDAGEPCFQLQAVPREQHAVEDEYLVGLPAACARELECSSVAGAAWVDSGAADDDASAVAGLVEDVGNQVRVAGIFVQLDVG